MSKVTVFTKNGCPQCVGAKMLLSSKGIPFEEINVSLDEDDRERALSYGLMGAPIIVAEGTSVPPFAGFNPEKIKQIITELED